MKIILAWPVFVNRFYTKTRPEPDLFPSHTQSLSETEFPEYIVLNEVGARLLTSGRGAFIISTTFTADPAPGTAGRPSGGGISLTVLFNQESIVIADSEAAKDSAKRMIRQNVCRRSEVYGPEHVRGAGAGGGSGMDGSAEHPRR